MIYMNDYDRLNAISRFTQATKPNLLALALVVDNLAGWADDNSDGWAYWPKPVRAAQRAIELIEQGLQDERDHGCRSRPGMTGVVEFVDITDAELVAAIKPIRAFLTRQGVSKEYAAAHIFGSLR